MNFYYVLTVLAAGITMANAKCDASSEPPCKYDCPLIGKDFYGNDITCGYNLAADWKACGKDGNSETIVDSINNCIGHLQSIILALVNPRCVVLIYFFKVQGAKRWLPAPTGLG